MAGTESGQPADPATVVAYNDFTIQSVAFMNPDDTTQPRTMDCPRVIW